MNDRQVALIRQILAENTDAIEQVALFGSRAQGTHSPHSDIDLILYGNIDETTTDRIWTLFHESDMPFKVDINVYQNIHYPPLKRHIDAESKPLFSRREIYSLNGTAS